MALMLMGSFYQEDPSTFSRGPGLYELLDIVPGSHTRYCLDLESDGDFSIYQEDGKRKSFGQYHEAGDTIFLHYIARYDSSGYLIPFLDSRLMTDTLKMGFFNQRYVEVPNVKVSEFRKRLFEHYPASHYNRLVSGFVRKYDNTSNSLIIREWKRAIGQNQQKKDSNKEFVFSQYLHEVPYIIDLPCKGVESFYFRLIPNVRYYKFSFVDWVNHIGNDGITYPPLIARGQFPTGIRQACLADDSNLLLLYWEGMWIWAHFEFAPIFQTEMGTRRITETEMDSIWDLYSPEIPNLTDSAIISQTVARNKQNPWIKVFDRGFVVVAGSKQQLQTYAIELIKQNFVIHDMEFCRQIYDNAEDEYIISPENHSNLPDSIFRHYIDTKYRGSFNQAFENPLFGQYGNDISF